MKKIFTLACVAAMATASFAQTESAFADATTLLGEDASTTAVSVAAGTVVCSSENITMKAAFDDTYKIVSMAAEADIANQVVINGTTYDMPKGIQGQTNPKPTTVTDCGQNSGAVFQFDVKADGVLYVFGKISGNKTYYVWEGDVANAQGLPVAYTFKGQPAKTEGVVGYTLTADKDGYYPIDGTYDNGTALADASQSVDIYAGKTTCADLIAAGTNITNTWGTTWTADNALGVIAFPVYADAEKYFVNATGSKITANGFVFVPGATEIGTIAFTKNGTDGINTISAETANANAPIFNLAGQQVSKTYKGIVLQNGKKRIQK